MQCYKYENEDNLHVLILEACCIHMQEEGEISLISSSSLPTCPYTLSLSHNLCHPIINHKKKPTGTISQRTLNSNLLQHTFRPSLYKGPKRGEVAKDVASVLRSLRIKGDVKEKTKGKNWHCFW